jgi:hypothetical protein
LLLPETKGKDLFETMVEAEKVYNKKPKKSQNEDRKQYEPVDTE